MFGVAFLCAGSLWFFFIEEVAPCGYGWTSGLSCFLVRKAWVFVLVGGVVFVLCEVQMVSSSEFRGVCRFGMTLGRLYFSAQVYIPGLLEN